MKTITNPRLFSALALAIPLLAACSGCGGDASASTPADPDRARTVLTAALDAWKAGEPHDAPGRLSPPIRVADEEWLAGARLTGYTLGEPGTPVGPSVPYPVVLDLRGPNGRPARRPVTYNVTTEPHAMVIRQD